MIGKWNFFKDYLLIMPFIFFLLGGRDIYPTEKNNDYFNKNLH